MCTIFIAIAGSASELGMSAALIQKKTDAEAEKMYNTAFWSGLIWGICVYLIMALAVSPLAAYFYDEPILKKLIPVLSIGILMSPLSMIHTVKLTRDMNFKRIAKIFNLSALIAGLTSLGMAYYGFGVWSLVANNVLSTTLVLPFLFYSTRWVPGWKWDWGHFKEVFGFGAYAGGTEIFRNITYNIDNLLVGKYLGASLLGSYTLAFSLTEQLRQIVSSVLSKVMYPVFGKNQDDPAKLNGYFLKIVRINAIMIYPLMGFFLIFGRQLILDFFGERWSDSIIPLQILSVAMMIHLIVNSFASLLRGLGKPKLEMKIILGLTLFLLIPGLLLGIWWNGLVGVAVAILVHKIGLVGMALRALNREIGLPIKNVFLVLKNPLLGIFAGGALVLLIRLFFGFHNFYVLSALYSLVYVSIIYLFEKSYLKNLINQMR